MDRLLRLLPGERRVVAPAAAAAFASAAGLTLASSSIDALLFAGGGVDDLPVLYLFLGGTMFLATLGVSVLLGRLGRGRAFLAIPSAIALIVVASRVLLGADVGWIHQALWLLRGASEFLLGMAVWGLAGLVTDTRQAKRFFPLIGGAAVLGQVLAGLATRPLAAWLGTENLILVWLATLVLVVFLGRKLVGDAGAGVRPPRRRRPSAVAEMREGLRQALRSPLLRWMSVGSILFSLLFFSLYLPFSRAAVARYPRPDELAGFLGLFVGVSTAVTLLLALVVMNRLLSRLGVPTVMMVLPVLYLAAFGVLTVASTFAILLAFRFAQVVWLQGGANSAWEAVINTVPGERRDRMRAFLYGGPTQVGTVLAGIVTLVGERAVSPRVLYALGLVAAVGATYAMARVRRAYAAELVLALREGRPQVFGGEPGAGEPFGLIRADRAAAEVAVEAMGDADVGVRRVAAELLGGIEAPEATEALIRGVRDEDPEVRATALRSLARARGVLGVRRDPRSAERPRARGPAGRPRRVGRPAGGSFPGAGAPDRSGRPGPRSRRRAAPRGRAGSLGRRGRRGRRRGRRGSRGGARATHEVTACGRPDRRVPRARVVAVRGGDVAGANGARGRDPVRAGGGGAHDDRGGSDRRPRGGDRRGRSAAATSSRPRARRWLGRRSAAVRWSGAWRSPRPRAPSRAAGSGTRSTGRGMCG